MFSEATGDLFGYAGPRHIIVIPVNCKGVLGAGVAKQFRSKYPEVAQTYYDLCNREKMNPGEVYMMTYGMKTFALAATKYQWQYPSQEVWIARILTEIRRLGTQTRWRGYTWVLPLLGAGLGRLDPHTVRGLIRYLFDDVADLHGILVTRPEVE